MTTKIKICGLQTLAETLDAIELGADYLGFVFDPKSDYFIEPELCQEILEDVPSEIQKVGVFTNAELQDVKDVAVMLSLDYLQLDGHESPDYCDELARPILKTFYPQSLADIEIMGRYSCDYFLIQAAVQSAQGSAGLIGNWDLVREAMKIKPIFLSGNLSASNVGLAIQAVRPFAVSVREGVEGAGRQKDYSKIQEFVQRVRHA